MDNGNPERGPVRPIFIDLGKRREKRIKQLKRGEGPLPQELAGVIEQVKRELAGEELAGKTLLPVVVIYKAKKKKPRPKPVLTLPVNGS